MAVQTTKSPDERFMYFDKSLHITLMYEGLTISGKIAELEDVFMMRKLAMEMTGKLADELLQIHRPSISTIGDKE